MAGASEKKRAEENTRTLRTLRMLMAGSAAVYLVCMLFRLGAIAKEKRWWTSLVFFSSLIAEGMAYKCGPGCIQLQKQLITQNSLNKFRLCMKMIVYTRVELFDRLLS